MPRYPQTERLVSELRRMLRTRGYSVRTEQAYAGWVKRFLSRSGHRHPAALGKEHVEAYLSFLANEERVSAKTRNQAASALAFLFREVLGRDVLSNVPRAKGKSRVPTVLSHEEVHAVLAELTGRKQLIAAVLYGTGMRLSEALTCA